MASLLRWITVCSLPLLASAPCSAATLNYDFKLVDYPGAAATSLLSINDFGIAVGQAVNADGTQLNFTYDTKKGSFTVLPNVPGAIDTNISAINDAGVIVGSQDDTVTEGAVILDRKGNFTRFANPAWANTEARGISPSGFVVGYSYNAAGDSSTGFLYDPIFKKFTTFLPSALTLAQGINAIGDIVGSVNTPNGRFGFVRSSGGGISQFQVGGVATSPRGITDFGRVTGFVAGATGQVGFVGTLQGMSFQTFVVPGATRTLPESINNLGLIVGQAVGPGVPHGFVATPVILPLR